MKIQKMSASDYAAHDLGFYGCTCKILGGNAVYEDARFLGNDYKRVMLWKLVPKTDNKGNYIHIIRRYVNSDVQLEVNLTDRAIDYLRSIGD